MAQDTIAAEVEAFIVEVMDSVATMEHTRWPRTPPARHPSPTFCSLDAQSRLQTQQMLLRLWHELHMTVVFVTHDVDEAVFLSSRVIVLSKRPGRIKAQIPVDLPRPRDHRILTSPEFTRLKREALDLLLIDPAPGVCPSSERAR
jgi:hypothetical protein